MERAGPEPGEPRLPGRAAHRRDSWWEEWSGGALFGALLVVALLYAFWRPLRPLVVTLAFLGTAWAGWRLAGSLGAGRAWRWGGGAARKPRWPGGKGKRRRRTEHKRW